MQVRTFAAQARQSDAKRLCREKQQPADTSKLAFVVSGHSPAAQLPLQVFTNTRTTITAEGPQMLSFRWLALSAIESKSATVVTSAATARLLCFLMIMSNSLRPMAHCAWSLRFAKDSLQGHIQVSTARLYGAALPMDDIKIGRAGRSCRSPNSPAA